MNKEIPRESSLEATALMNKVQQAYSKIHSFHAIVRGTTENPADPTPDPPVRMETWFDHPNVRTDTTVGGVLEHIFVGDERFWYMNSGGNWTRRERKPDSATDALFAIIGIIPVDTFISLSEQTLEGRAAWALQGISKEVNAGSSHTRTTLWIDKATYFVLQVRMAHSQAKEGLKEVLLHSNTLVCQVFEPGIEISSTRFTVPPDVPVGEPKLFKGLQYLASPL